MTGSDLCVDVAGATSGGAARFRSELVSYLDERKLLRVKLIGIGRSLSSQWLLQRERSAGFSARLAVNNVSFVGPGRKTVLLRNALHFLRPFEREEYLRTVPGIAAQIRLVHAACRRADLIVTPTHDMADRVSSELPHVASRILVRPHPLTFQPSGRKLNNLPDAPFVLSPALSAAHKDSAAHLRRISAALGSLHRPELVAVTAQSADLPPDLQADSRIRAIGPQPVEDMADWYACSSAIYFPTSVESFGYPLAEARAIGRAVIAIDSQQNREVAGDALCGYSPTSTESFRKAVETALAGSANSIEPDPNHFDRAAYFDWLLSKATNG